MTNTSTNISPSALRKQGIRFAHFRPVVNGAVLPYGGVTFAYKQAENGEYLFSRANCRADTETGHADLFNRKLGATIAGGRLLASEQGRSCKWTARMNFTSPADALAYFAEAVKGEGLVRRARVNLSLIS